MILSGLYSYSAYLTVSVSFGGDTRAVTALCGTRLCPPAAGFSGRTLPQDYPACGNPACRTLPGAENQITHPKWVLCLAQTTCRAQTWRAGPERERGSITGSSFWIDDRRSEAVATSSSCNGPSLASPPRHLNVLTLSAPPLGDTYA